MTFADAAFDHVNCQGVIHHTPDTPRALSEIARVLRPGGTASISVYFRNASLRHWRTLRPFARLAATLGSRLKGRGREDIFSVMNEEDIVRLYDGAANPIGKAYSVEEITQMARQWFVIEETYFHFFPARSLPLPVPAALHRLLDRQLPFMIYLNLRRA